jgi:hypothetical protein
MSRPGQGHGQLSNCLQALGQTAFLLFRSISLRPCVGVRRCTCKTKSQMHAHCSQADPVAVPGVPSQCICHVGTSPVCMLSAKRVKLSNVFSNGADLGSEWRVCLLRTFLEQGKWSGKVCWPPCFKISGFTSHPPLLIGQQNTNDLAPCMFNSRTRGTLFVDTPSPWTRGPSALHMR